MRTIRTAEGGFWHKNISSPDVAGRAVYGSGVSAQYAVAFDEPSLFDDVALQFTLMEKHAR